MEDAALKAKIKCVLDRNLLLVRLAFGNLPGQLDISIAISPFARPFPLAHLVGETGLDY